MVGVCNRRKGKGLVVRAFGLSRVEGVRQRRWIGGLDLFPEDEKQKEYLIEKYRSYVYADRWEELEEVVARILKDRGLKLAVAESCTGGLLSARLVNVPGSSLFFLGGFVVYANELKSKLLSVEERLLSTHGAVSEEVCRSMCVGVLEETDADVSIAITGIAGPSGGSKEKPVGLTYIGLGWDQGVVVEKHIFRGSRNVNRFLSTQTALNMLRKFLLGEL